jgi:hypothetical protein
MYTQRKNTLRELNLWLIARSASLLEQSLEAFEYGFLELAKSLLNESVEINDEIQSNLSTIHFLTDVEERYCPN